MERELLRWTTLVREESRTDEFWTAIKPGAESVLTDAGRALADGRPTLAVERLLAARVNLSAATYLSRQPAATRSDLAAFELEWQRMSGVLGLDRPRRSGREVARSGSAFRRAIEEAAFLQVKVNYDASLAYGRSTTPESGLTYLGIAEAHHDTVALAESLVPDDRRSAPRLRSLVPDIDALQRELLTAYRPPASLDRHPEFIGVSALLKEARELEAAELRFGALYRYLQAALRYGAIKTAPADALTGPELGARVRDAATRAAAGSIDHSLAELFVERAAFELARAGSDAPVPIANAIVTEVLPRYYAALEPSSAAPRPTDVPVTITLVRWPYT
jgi:hypothetical protein